MANIRFIGDVISITDFARFGILEIGFAIEGVEFLGVGLLGNKNKAAVIALHETTPVFRAKRLMRGGFA